MPKTQKANPTQAHAFVGPRTKRKQTQPNPTRPDLKKKTTRPVTRPPRQAARVYARPSPAAASPLLHRRSSRTTHNPDAPLSPLANVDAGHGDNLPPLSLTKIDSAPRLDDSQTGVAIDGELLLPSSHFLSCLLSLCAACSPPSVPVASSPEVCR